MKMYTISGAPRSGKNLFVSLVAEALGQDRVYETSTVEVVKDIAKYCGWTGEKSLKDRKFLSDLKDILEEWNDLSYRSIKRFVEDTYWWTINYPQLWEKVVIFVHAREEKDINRLKKDYGAKSILIRNPIAESTTYSNHADKNVLNSDYDIDIFNSNNSIEEFREIVKFFTEQENLD